MRPKNSSNFVAFEKSTEVLHFDRAPRVNSDLEVVAPTKTDRQGTRLPTREIDFLQLNDGSLVDVVENPTDADSTSFAIFEDGEIRFADKFEYRGEILVPIPRTAAGFAEMKLPSGVAPYESISSLVDYIHWFLRQSLDLPLEYALATASFVLHTWVSDRLPQSVYLSVIGLPQSGKSTLLELLSLVCRRPLLVSEISQAALHRVCSRFKPTLLIDEMEWRSSQSGTAMRQMLRAGTNRSAGALRAQGAAWLFGPKVLSSLEPSPDVALNSRCLQIPMAETRSRDLIRPSDPRLQKEASEIRKALLSFRFCSWASICPVEVAGAEDLRPRSRDLLAALASPFPKDSLERTSLLHFFKTCHDPSTRESLPPRQDALLSVLFDTIHDGHFLKTTGVRLGGPSGLTALTNALLSQSGERVEVTEKAVGTILTSMGFRNRQRTNVGWVLWLDSAMRERTHQLIETHGNPGTHGKSFKAYEKDCDICRALSGHG